MQVLVALVQAYDAGEIVSRDDLLERCWHGVVVGEDAIDRVIGQLRRLCHSLGGAYQLETITKVGYRLVASGAGEAPAVGLKAADAEIGPRRLLAVMAFDNLSRDPDMEFFSDGISDEILQAVSRIKDVRVIGRASSFHFRGADKSAANIAAKLNTTHVLDGSIQRSGGRVRIAASLVDCATATSLWSDRFDRELADVFALQDEISSAVAEALMLAFAPTEAARKVKPEAHDLYLRARGLAGAYATHRECMALLEATVVLAPDFAEAWASLALANADAGWRSGPEGFEPRRSRAVEAIDRAMAIDPSLGLGLVVRSLLVAPGAYLEREALLDSALEASPSDPEILKQVSDFVGAVGRTRESFRLIARAHEVDPLNPVMANRHAGALSEIGLLKESFEASEVGRQRSPDFEWFVASPLLIAGSIGDWDVAEPLRVLALRKGGLILSAIAELVEGFRNPTAEAKTRLLLRTEGELSRTGSIEIGQILFLHRLGMEEEAFDLLERASYSHMLTPNGRAADGRFLQGIIFGTLGASVRRDPRFVRLCDKLGLCRYWLATGRWPDCADDHQLPYDFRAEVRRIGAAA